MARLGVNIDHVATLRQARRAAEPDPVHAAVLAELAKSAMERVPQVLENLTLPARHPLEQMKQLSLATTKVKDALKDDGRVLIRWSGTEPKLRIMLEGPNEDRLRKWAKDLAAAAQKDAKV